MAITSTSPKTELQREQEYIAADIQVAKEFASQTFSSVEGMFAAVMALVSTRSGLKVITAKEQLDTTSERAKMRKELESLLTELESIMHDQTGTLAGIKDLTKRAKATELAYKINYLANELGYCPAAGEVNPPNFEPPPERKFGLVGDATTVGPAFNGPDAEAKAGEDAQFMVCANAVIKKTGTIDKVAVYQVTFPENNKTIDNASLSLIANGKVTSSGVIDARSLDTFIDDLDKNRARIDKSGSPEEKAALAKFDACYGPSRAAILSKYILQRNGQSVNNGIALTANLSTIQGAQQRVRGDVTTDGEKINQHSSAVTTEYKKSTDNISLAQDYIQGLGKKMGGIVNNF